MQTEEEKSNYNKIVKYTSLFGGIQVITLLTSIIRNKLIALILGPSGVGLIAIYNVVLKVLNDSTNFGISFSSIRNISEISVQKDPEKLKSYINIVRKWSLLTGLFGIVVCILLSSPLSYWTFKNYDHTHYFIFLSPVVGLTALCGGELAILKGLRQIRVISYISILTALIVLFISVPLYYIFGIKAIVASIVLASIATTFITLFYSLRISPFQITKKTREDWSVGKNMIKVGIPFIMAGILGSGVEYIIRTFILKNSTEAIVGLYSAGFTLTVTYAGMVFAAMESDYFPRLSAVNNQIKKLNKVVNQQIEIAILLITPLLIIFLIFLPIILQLLYSSKFIPAIRMAECAALGMFFRAITIPLAYISLAKGKAFVYLILELLYDVCMVVLALTLFNRFGLTGTGMAITIAAFCNILIVYPCVRFLYKFRLSKEMIQTVSLQIPWIIIAFLLTSLDKNIIFWISGISCFLISTAISLYQLNKKTTILQALKNRIK